MPVLPIFNRPRAALLLLWPLAGVLAGMIALPAQAELVIDEHLPPTLADTGFFSANKQSFSPQYPLWTDGADKQRWIALPDNGAIDASQPDAWQFPPGTRLWKQFGFGRPVETRYIEHTADGRWRFASYLWDSTGTTATLAPPEGIPRWPVAEAPGGHYAVPSRQDCLACHEAAPVPVLGFSALQLSPRRDALALHGSAAQPYALNLLTLADAGKLQHVPPELLAHPPAIQADTAQERAALGYLHGNCGHCHNDTGPLDGLELSLLQSSLPENRSVERTLATLAGRTHQIEERMASRSPSRQMPPLGTQVTDDLALALIRQWIQTAFSPNHPTPQGATPMNTPHLRALLIAIPLLALAQTGWSESANRPTDNKYLIERGKYLVTVSVCHDCHTPWKMGPQGPEPDMDRALSGHPADAQFPLPPALPDGPWVMTASATNTAWSGPWGISYTANLTPDRETGLGKWNLRNFKETIRTGRHMGRGRELLPPMPIPQYKNFNDQDLTAIFAYLQSIPAIRNKVPEPLPPPVTAASASVSP